MFSVEKPSILNTIARRAMEQYISEGSISIMNLLNKKSLDKIAENTREHTFEKLSEQPAQVF